MKTVYFIRHGESESNIGGIRRGHATLLTENGKKQAEVVASRATKLSIDSIISSTMERAKETAQIIAVKTGKPIEYSELFVERKDPSWFIGRTNNDPELLAVETEMRKNFTSPDFRLADEENYEDLKKRALAALEYLRERKEESMVIVSHGFFLRVVLATAIYGRDLSAHGLDGFMGGTVVANTGISMIKEDERWRSGWKLHIFNDHAHLAE